MEHSFSWGERSSFCYKSIIVLLLHYRFLVDMPSGTVFIVFAVLIRMIEGVGWAMTVATTFAFLPILYPSRVATLTVS